MKTAEQIADEAMRQAQDIGPRKAILAALQEYGELVRQRAAGVCQTVPCDCDLSDGHDCVVFQCAAAVERMELP